MGNYDPVTDLHGGDQEDHIEGHNEVPESQAVGGHVLHILIGSASSSASGQGEQDSVRDGGVEEGCREDARRAEGARLAKVGGDQGELGREQERRRRL